MFEEGFGQLFRAVEKIEQQLAQTNDAGERQRLTAELIALRNLCDTFVEKWLAFEERIACLGETYDLSLDGGLPAAEIHDLHTSWAEWTEKLQEGNGALPPVWPDHPTEEMARAFRRGIGFYDLYLFQEAIGEFEKVIQLDSDFVIARIYLALGYLARKEYEQAVRHLRLASLSAQGPLLRAAVHTIFAHVYANLGEYGQAAEEFSRVVELAPDDRDALFNLAVCYYNAGAFQQALQAFYRTASGEEDWEVHRYIARTWMRLGGPERALPHLEKAYRYNSLHEDIILELTELYLQLGHKEEAWGLLRRAQEFLPQKGNILLAQGWLAMREGRFPEAVALFKKYLSLRGGDKQVLFYLGWSYLKLKEYLKAETCFLSLLREEPDHPHARTGLAYTRYQRGEREEAKKDLRQMSHGPSPEGRYLGQLYLGRIALEETAYDEAACLFGGALELNPNCAESLFYKGLTHYALGEYEKADRYFARCRGETYAIPKGAAAEKR